MLDMSMIDVRFWKAYSAYYGDKSPIGKLLYDAQAQSYLYEDAGIQITNETCNAIIPQSGKLMYHHPSILTDEFHDPSQV